MNSSFSAGRGLPTPSTCLRQTSSEKNALTLTQTLGRGQRPRPAQIRAEHRHIQLGTFSKAFGSLGGYVAGDKNLIDYLRNFAKTAIYSTALPPAVLAASLASLKIIAQKKLAKKCLENAQYFCELMNLPKPESAIIPIIIGDNKKTLDIAKQVADKGFLISAIRPPSVEPGKSRLRITFSAQHTKNQIKKLSEIIRLILA
jgi:8-amino-7-oxononanoate synthase